MRSIYQHSTLLRKLGQEEYRREYVRPVLLGLGLQGELVDERQRRRSGTLTHISEEAEFLPASIVGRAWLLTKGPEGPQRAEVYLGRAAFNDVVVPEYTISNQHCHFKYQPGRVLMTDLGSLNGSSVDGERLLPQKPAILKDRSRLILGRAHFEYLTAATFFSMIQELSKNFV